MSSQEEFKAFQRLPFKSIVTLCKCTGRYVWNVCDPLKLAILKNMQEEYNVPQCPVMIEGNIENLAVTSFYALPVLLF